MKVAVDITSSVFSPYGLKSYTRGILEGFEKVNQEIDMIWFSQFFRDFDNKCRQFPQPKNSRHTLKLFRQSDKLKKIIERQLKIPLTAKILKKLNIDLFHCLDNVSLGMGKQIPTLLTIHGMPFTKHPELYVNSKYPDEVRESLKQCDHVVTVSNFSRQEILKNSNLDEKQITVISSGLDKIFQTMAPDEHIQSVIKKYHLEEDYMIYIGGLRPLKNLPRMIEAHHQARQQGFSINQFVLTGSWVHPDPQLQKFLNPPDSKKTLCLLKHVPQADLPALLAGAKLFFFATLHEGFGLPILEAMSQKTPVITSCISAHPETAGGWAQLVNPLSTSEMTEALLEAQNNPAKKEDLEKARDWALSHNWETTSKKLLKLYLSIL